MTRLLQIVVVAGAAIVFAACAESNATEPQRAAGAPAAGDVVGFAAPSPSVSCTVVQLDATHYAATAAWSGLSVVGLEFFDGTTLLAQTQFAHPIRNGSLTDTLLSAPTIAELIGKSLGARTLCITAP
jgi:hypothetical protein